MLRKCDLCEQVKSGVLRFTEIVDGRVEEPCYLCEECSHVYFPELNGEGEPKGLTIVDSTPESGIETGVFGSDALIDLLMKLGSQAEEPCPSCGMMWKEFDVSGRLSCSVCYDHFEAGLLPIFRRFHGSDRHEGKHPKHLTEPQSLPDRLDAAVLAEDYELASELKKQMDTEIRTDSVDSI